MRHVVHIGGSIDTFRGEDWAVSTLAEVEIIAKGAAKPM